MNVKDDDLSEAIICSISPMRRSDDTDRFISSPSAFDSELSLSSK